MSKENFSKQDKIAVVVLLFLIIGIFAISLFLPDEKPGAIRKELMKQGYEVENVGFEYIRDGDGYNEWIYQSSMPVYYKGHYVSQWSVYSYSFTSLFIHYHVRPYPSLPEPVMLSITFKPEEFERILESANGQQIEEYIKQIVNDSMGEEAGKE